MEYVDDGINEIKHVLAIPESIEGFVQKMAELGRWCKVHDLTSLHSDSGGHESTSCIIDDVCRSGQGR